MLRKVLAYLRLSQRAICEESAGLSSTADYHDYPDSVNGVPWHFTPMRCRHCGKEFYI